MLHLGQPSILLKKGHGRTDSSVYKCSEILLLRASVRVLALVSLPSMLVSRYGRRQRAQAVILRAGAV